MANSFYEITVNNTPYTISVDETTSREITISGRVYAVPASLTEFIRQMADEIETQQKRRIATDEQINQRIDGRVDKMVKALAANNMLAKPLKSEYPQPPGVEVSGGTWTFADGARVICRRGLRNEYGDDLADDIGSQGSYAKRRRGTA